MLARSAQEKPMTDDSRIVKLEADVQHVQSDLSETKSMLERLQESFESFKIEILRELGSFKAEVAREFGSFKAEVAKGFESVARESGSFKAEVAKESGSFRTEVAKEFGSLRTSIERAKLWMLVTGAGTILSVWAAAFALARFLKP